ncbi:threonine/serine exporter ThrE family protein [Spirillospora sp. NPDC050679]
MGTAAERLRRSWYVLMDGAPPEPPEDEPGEDVDPRVIDLVLRVGELLLASGESTERVNEAMLSLAVAYELPRCEVQVSFTSLLVSSHPGNGAAPVTGTRAIRRRTPAFWRLHALHALVQQAAIGMLELDEAHQRLAEIKRGRAPYPPWLMVVSLGLIAASASVLVGGGPIVAVTAFVATLLGDRAAAYLARRGVAEFFQLSLAAAMGATAAALVVAIMGTPGRASTIVTGAILALLPGRPLVASVQDGITGDLVSAGARLLEVFFIIAAIVAGLGAVVYVAVALDVDINVSHLPDFPALLKPVPVLAAAAVSLTFAVCLAVPRDVLLPAAVGGGVIWVVYVLLLSASVAPVLASAISAVLIGVLGSMLARRRNAPSLPYVVPAISPLLPGTLLYRGMVELNTGSAQEGALSLVAALSVALALGAGVNLGGELVRAFQTVGLSASGRWARPAARRTRGY